MAEIKRATLFGKLNPIGYKAIEAATVFCKMRGNPYVETVHWLHQLLQQPDSDVLRIIRHFSLDASRLATDLTVALDRLPRGATAISDFSPQIETALQQAWIYSTLLFGEGQVRTGHLVVAFLKSAELRNSFTALSKEFSKIKAEALSDEFHKIVAGSVEDAQRASDGSGLSADAAPGETSGAIGPAEMGKQEALKRFTTNLTERVRKGEIDPIIGRDEEIRQCVDILMRRRQNNPILTGEAGVGKTAVVEGFAHRIVAGDVPPAIKDVDVLSLDIGLLQAGASMKGEFEQRLRSVIDEVQASPKPIILFIDEVHTLVGAGGAAGTGDAANLLKPALARGTLRTIAATTWDEYKKYIEKDPALTRRFQTVKVDEPDEEKCIRMMRAVVAPFEKHHRVQILDEAIDSAVRLSHRYIPARQLPDKAVSLIDTASARVAVSQHAVPAEVDDCRRRIQALETEIEIIGRETAVGMDHVGRSAAIHDRLAGEQKKLAELEKHWSEEKELVNQILDLRGKLRGSGEAVDQPEAKPAEAKEGNGGLKPEERDKLLAELREKQAKLKEFQGENPLIFPSVDEGAIASVVADWTGIPVGRMVKNEIEQVLKLADILERRVIGQRHALEQIARRIQTSRARLDNPNRPIGVFMLAGPSGTGKTETALSLAEALYGGEQNLISINMSEFQEAHTVSTLKGSPPGYVGYGEGGILTEAVRRKPYSVVLLDEVEKAHSDVHEIFFQVFDKGWMEDSEGRFIDFKNTIIILTSNAAQDVVISMCKDPELMPSADGLEKAMRGPLTKVFPDALLNRLVVIPFFPISQEMLKVIIGLNLKKVERRVIENHRVPFTYEESIPELIARRCTELERGARMVDAMITNTLLPEIGREVLTRLAEGRAIERVHVLEKEGDFAFAFE
ncbi:MAG TPA: type VI secretion system ATPase TssH [Verrucomicrobiales bacterium]|nr:type VI secretion system ATPase TssH [Verrucomicrobiales bacterium]